MVGVERMGFLEEGGGSDTAITDIYLYIGQDDRISLHVFMFTALTFPQIQKNINLIFFSQLVSNKAQLFFTFLFLLSNEQWTLAESLR